MALASPGKISPVLFTLKALYRRTINIYRRLVVSNLYTSHFSTFAPEYNLLFLFDLDYLARILLSLIAAHAKLICANNKEAIQ